MFAREPPNERKQRADEKACWEEGRLSTSSKPQTAGSEHFADLRVHPKATAWEKRRHINLERASQPEGSPTRLRRLERSAQASQSFSVGPSLLSKSKSICRGPLPTLSSTDQLEQTSAKEESVDRSRKRCVLIFGHAIQFETAIATEPSQRIETHCAD